MKKCIKSALIVLVCALTAVVIAVFAGCSVDYGEVYNDDAKIISYNGNYSAVGRVRNVHGDGASVSCMSFSGVDTLYSSFNVKGGSAELTLNYTGEEGKLKLVLTDSGKVYVLKEIGWLEGGLVESGSGGLDFSQIPNGKYKLKIVGYKAEFSMQLSL